MQENNQTISEFIRRTDLLAARKGLNLSEIHEFLGISKAMVFGYRGGKNRITGKVWLKLEAAERDAGINDLKPDPEEAFAQSERNIDNRIPPDSRKDDPMKPCDMHTDPALLKVLERIANSLERLAVRQWVNDEPRPDAPNSKGSVLYDEEKEKKAQ